MTSSPLHATTIPSGWSTWKPNRRFVSFGAVGGLAFSATGEYLAGAVEGDLGVQLWTNRTLFKHVPTRQISDKEIGQISAPTASGEGGQGLIEAAFEAAAEDEQQAAEEEDGVTAPVLDQLSAEQAQGGAQGAREGAVLPAGCRRRSGYFERARARGGDQD